jgi:hypothetical protein
VPTEWGALDVSCWLCDHRAILSADSWPDDLPVLAFGPRTYAPPAGLSVRTRGLTGESNAAGLPDGDAMAVTGRNWGITADQRRRS